MIHCSSFTDGKTIFEFSRSQKLRLFPTSRYRTPLSNGSSAPLEENSSTTVRSGVLSIWNENYLHSKTTTIAIARSADSGEPYRSCSP